MDARLVLKGGKLDLGLAGGDLAKGLDLQTAVLLSLFTDRRASDDDILPDGQAVQSIGARRGWWGDTFAGVQNDQIGSRLWLLKREKQTNATLNRARQYAQEALNWLVDDGIASRVTVDVAWFRFEGLAIYASIARPTGITNFKYAYAWDDLVNGIGIIVDGGITPPVDGDNNWLLDEYGNPILTEDGNPIELDSPGLLLGDDGDPLLTEAGDPIEL